MNAQDYLFPAYFVVIIFVSAFSHKLQRVALITALGLVAVYPNPDAGTFIFLFIIPASILASFTG
ncbi:MAG: hypothetical protein C4586_07420 [Anaerolineaceae bacterium]|nr:MAG: hypothetical protein C4586_07420 [Anaerolineaceae bacterium]